MPKYLPGFEPEEATILMKSFFQQVDRIFPDMIIVWSEWNHAELDETAKYLSAYLGYHDLKEFLQVYGYKIVLTKPDTNYTAEQLTEKSNKKKRRNRPERSSYSGIITIILFSFFFAISIFFLNKVLETPSVKQPVKQNLSGSIEASSYEIEEKEANQKLDVQYADAPIPSNTITQKQNTQSKLSSTSPKPFTNKYGTSTTICAHSGCINYIASSGDTNCCTTHSHKCADCGCYIDEDAIYCISCIAKSLDEVSSSKSSSQHICQATGCAKDGACTITGLSGQTEYYCYEHYAEMLSWMEKFS